MRQLRARHVLLFRSLRDHCSFLTRKQIERIWTLPTNATNKDLLWLASEKYLRRRYRADTFGHFQTPVYYLGELGWQAVGKPADEYKSYRAQVEQRSEHRLDHTLSVYDVILKFNLESTVKRIIHSEAKLWQETIDFGIVPDAWIQFRGGEAFIAVDRDTERPIVLERKFDKYVAFNESGGYSQLFPDCAFRVLVFTTTEERIQSLEQRTRSDDVWFCVMEEFVQEKLSHQHWFAQNGFYALPVAQEKEV